MEYPNLICVKAGHANLNKFFVMKQSEIKDCLKTYGDFDIISKLFIPVQTGIYVFWYNSFAIKENFLMHKFFKNSSNKYINKNLHLITKGDIGISFFRFTNCSSIQFDSYSVKFLPMEFNTLGTISDHINLFPNYFNEKIEPYEYLKSLYEYYDYSSLKIKEIIEKHSFDFKKTSLYKQITTSNISEIEEVID